MPAWMIKAIQRRYFRMLSAWRQPWYGELSASQDMVEKYCENGYYKAAYRGEELYYWHQVAGWMYQDAALLRGGRILDIGSAYGTLAVYAGRLFRTAIHCVDFSDRYLAAALCEKCGLLFAVSNVELDPLPWEGTFDAIIFTEILEHLNFNPLPTMQKLRAALKPGGRLYLSTPDAGEWGRLPNYADFREMPLPRPGTEVVDAHIYQYTMAEMRELAEAAGFRVEREGFSIGVGGRHISVVLLPR